MIKSFNGKTPKVAKSAFVSEGAHVIGDVEIGENSNVWPGAVIRGDMGSIKIGANTSIQDNSVLHAELPMEIGNNVLIGHSAVVHGINIGNHTLIGNNATILDETHIGNFCIIGAGCVISQGMEIPDNSLVVGVPGKIKGKPSPKQLWWVKEAPQIYAKLAKQYKEQGF